MKKIVVLLLFIGASNSINAQSKRIDTIVVMYDKFSSVQKLNDQNKFLFEVNGVLHLTKKSEKKCFDDTTNILGFFDNSNYSYYCKIYYKGKLIEEGKWNLYRFHGCYKSYFISGEIRSEGTYSYGVEIGKWIYYRKDGGIYKIIYYPNVLNGGSERKKGKIDIKKAIKYYQYPTPQDSINFVKSVKGRWLRRYR